MADTEQEYPLGFVDARNSGPATRNRSAAGNGLTTPANFDDVGALRARLNTINSTYYTTARLNSMSKNDMIYAVRLADEAGSIK